MRGAARRGSAPFLSDMDALPVLSRGSVAAVSFTNSANRRRSNLLEPYVESLGFSFRIDLDGLQALRALDLGQRQIGFPNSFRRKRAGLYVKLANVEIECGLQDESEERIRDPSFMVSPDERKQRKEVFLLGCSALVVGLAFSVCKPAVAGSMLSSTRSSATTSQTVVKADDVPSRPVVSERTKDTAQTKVLDGQSQATASSENSEEVDPNYEPPFGEGSDLSVDETEIMLRSYLERHPDDMKALQALLFFRMKKGEVNAAVGLLDRLVELEPRNIEWKFMRAQTLDFAGDLDLSRKSFNEILQIEPFSARAYQGLAVVMQKTGEHSLVLEMLEAAIKNATEASKLEEARNLRLLLGQMHTLQGNLKEALEQYNVLLKDDPDDFRPYLCKGLIYSILGMSKEADQFFRRYRKLCPKDFPNRGYLDELMLQAKTESRKLKERKDKESADKAKGKKPAKQMKQPGAVGTEMLGAEKGDH